MGEGVGGGGGGLGNFQQQKILAQQKLLRKDHARGAMGKN